MYAQRAQSDPTDRDQLIDVWSCRGIEISFGVGWSWCGKIK